MITKLNHFDDDDIKRLQNAVHKLLDMQKAMTFDEQRDFGQYLQALLDRVEIIPLEDLALAIKTKLVN